MHQQLLQKRETSIRGTRGGGKVMQEKKAQERGRSSRAGEGKSEGEWGRGRYICRVGKGGGRREGGKAAGQRKVGKGN